MAPKTHCYYCGHALTHRFIDGRERLYCPACLQPIYENPVPATCTVVVNAAKQVILVKRAVEPKIGQWCLPGGFIELNEPPEQSALRELAEETGLAGSIQALLGVRTTPSVLYHSVLMVGYLITDFHGRIKPGDDASDVRWFSLDDPPSIAFDSHRRFLDQAILRLG